MHKKKGTVCMIIGALLLLSALALALYNKWDADRAAKASEEIVSEIKDNIGNSDKTYDDMPTVEIDGNIYIGFIDVPTLNLTLPVMLEWDYEKLKISPCRYSGSYLNDDMVIAGHNYARHFSPLKWVDMGTEVYFTNVNGDVYEYYVDNRETIKPDEVDDMITKTDWDLTLFTCTTGGGSRCTIRCTRVKDNQ